MIHFLKYKFIYLAISLMVIGIGAFSLVTTPLDYSIDFTGGSNVQYRFKGDVTREYIRKHFAAEGIQVFTFELTGKNTYTLKTSPMDEKKEVALRKQLADDQKNLSVEQLRFETVGPSLGKETIRKTAIASA